MPSAIFPYSGFCHQVKSILVFASIFTCSISLLLHEQHKTTFRDDMNVTRGAQNKTKEKKIHHAAAIATHRFLKLF